MRALLPLLLLGAASAQEPHVLLVLLDDVGVDRVACYGLAPDPPATPTLDGLAARGVRFTRAWAQPYCGPSRASLLTGRQPSRHGLGKNVERGRGAQGLALDEWTLPEVLRAARPEVRTAACGKWHLASFEQGDDHGREQGFERVALTQGNLGDYSSYRKFVDGSPVEVERYATTDTVDDALALAAEFGDEPWLLYLALHAAHVPFHAPPAALHSREELDTDAALHKAAVEAADRELGRLLAGLPEDTLVVVVGDNGTPRPAIEPPFVPEHGKGTLYEGSLHVPLIVAGPGVAEGATSEALVSTVDLLPTVAGRFAVDARAVVPEARALDGRDLSALLAEPGQAGPHSVLLAARFEPNHSAAPKSLWRAARGERFKLLRNVGRGRDRLFDLALDPHEQRDLLEEELGEDARAAHARLAAFLDGLSGR